MLNRHTINHHFQRFCKAMYKDSGLTIIPFNVWKAKHIEELKESFDIVNQDAKLHSINTYKQPKP